MIILEDSLILVQVFFYKSKISLMEVQGGTLTHLQFKSIKRYNDWDYYTSLKNQLQDGALTCQSICETLTIPSLKRILFLLIQMTQTAAIQIINLNFFNFLLLSHTSPCVLKCIQLLVYSPTCKSAHSSNLLHNWIDLLQVKKRCSPFSSHRKHSTQDDPGLKTTIPRCCKATR